MPLRTGTIDRPSSERISMARALCILGMIYVHVPGALATPGIVQGLLVDGFGRAAAALLSVVSGWLCARALLSGRHNGRSIVMARMRSLILPMVFWSGLTVVVYTGVSFVHPTFLSDGIDRSLASTLVRFANTVLFLFEAEPGPTLHLSFLRDLFVCIALAPLLLWGLQRAAIPLLVVLAGLYLVHAQSIIMLRPLILFAFAVGLALQLYRIRSESVDRLLGVWMLGAVLSTLALMLLPGGIGDGPRAWQLDLRESLLYPVTRLFWALAIWSATARFTGTRFANLTRLHGPWVFIAYCSHLLLLSVVAATCIDPVIRRLPESIVPAMQTGWFLIAPFVAFAGARLVMTLLASRLPDVAGLAGIPTRYAHRSAVTQSEPVTVRSVAQV